MVKPWEIISVDTGYSCPLFDVRTKKVRSPRTGATLEVQAVHTPNWVMVLALTPSEEVLMVRQYRHGTEDIYLELPGGLVDAGDDSARLAAQRELMEETGHAANAFEKMGSCFPQPAVLTNECLFYLARDAVPVKGQQLEIGEDIDIIAVPLADIRRKMEKGEITHGMALLAFFFFQLKYGTL
jgi:8-oxo-dGTP pyrophosphatase MutT (NUDIX family)